MAAGKEVGETGQQRGWEATEEHFGDTAKHFGKKAMVADWNYRSTEEGLDQQA